jgi:hypothetical protein
MIILSETTDKITIKLDDTVTANQMQCFATWRDTRLEPVVILNVFIPNRSITTTNNTTEVDFILGPTVDLKRTVDFISVYNANSSSHTLTILFKTLTTSTILWKGTLAAGERLQYTDMSGFVAYEDDGSIKYTK